MRKNSVDSARIKRTNPLKRKLKALYYSVYEITGLNLDLLIKALNRNGIILYDVKKLSNKRLRVRIYSKDDEKFFAITTKMCYNVKKLKNNGKYYPLVFLYRNVGIFIGALILCVLAYVSNDMIFSISFTGSGNVYSSEVVNYLNENGIREFTRFSSVNMSELADGILASSNNFSFVSCAKVGNRLKINLALSEDSIKTLNNNGQELYSDVDGVIEKIKVYRGSQLFNVNDVVKAGDKLVSNIVTVGSSEVNTGCLAYVTIITNFSYTYISDSDNCEELACIYATEALGDMEIVKTEVNKQFKKGKYIYFVTLSYRRVLSTID